jgi:hypothetical protein
LNPGWFHFVFLLPLFHLENHICLSRGVQVAGASWRAVTRTVAGVGDLVQRTGMVAQVGYLVAGQSRGRVAPCAVCTWHVETRSTDFSVEPQNQGRRFVSGLALKPLRQFSLVWPQNQWRRFLPVWPQNWRLVSWLSLKPKVVQGFPVWTSKPTALVWLFGPQNHHDGFLVWASKPSGLQFIGCVIKPTEGGRRGTRVEI